MFVCLKILVLNKTRTFVQLNSIDSRLETIKI